MRLSLFAAAAFLAALAGAPSVEAQPSHGYKHSRAHGTHAHSASKRRYSNRAHSRHERRYSQRGHRYSQRYAQRAKSHRRYGHQARSHRQYAQRRHVGRRVASARTGGRPRAWCGWWMRTQLGGGPEYNLAANWRRYGRASGPRVGAVVVWPHHVGIITGRAGNGKWIVKSGNDGNAVRERARSVAGAVFRVG